MLFLRKHLFLTAESERGLHFYLFDLFSKFGFDRDPQAIHTKVPNWSKIKNNHQQNKIKAMAFRRRHRLVGNHFHEFQGKGLLFHLAGQSASQFFWLTSFDKKWISTHVVLHNWSIEYVIHTTFYTKRN